MTTDPSLSPYIVYGAVLFAALLHATWNALVKSGGDKLVIQALVIFFHMPPALLLLPFVPFPTPIAWLCIAASVVIHTIYYAALVGAYRVGDLSQVYPIARGSAPLLVALGAFLFIGETLAFGETLGLLLLSAGLISLAWRRRAAGAPRFEPQASPVLLALLTGLMIGGFSLVDGIGGRAAESALSYIAWLFVLEPLPIALFALQRRGWRMAAFRPYLNRGLFGGLISALAYAIVIWAMTAAPLAHVIALRETSVVLAALIGVLFLGERFGPVRLAAALLVACGAVLLRLGG